MNDIDADEVLSQAEAARLLGIGLRTLHRRQFELRMPVHGLGRRKMYLRSELLAWLRALPGGPETRVAAEKKTQVGRR